MQKQELLQLLDDKLDGLIAYINQQPEGTFAKQFVPGKWSNGEHLEHLRKTTRAINKGMKLPKLFLRYKFGVNNRTERSYEQTRHKYVTYLEESKAKSPEEFSPQSITHADKDRIIKWFDEEKALLKKIVSKHSEAQLSKYVIPHPLIGRLTFREFVYFTALHTDHHLALMKRYNA